MFLSSRRNALLKEIKEERWLLGSRLWNSRREVYHIFMFLFGCIKMIKFMMLSKLTPLYLLKSQIPNSILFFTILLPIVCFMAHVVIKSLMHLAWLMANAASTIPRNLSSTPSMVKMAILNMQDLIMVVLSTKNGHVYDN